MASLGKPVLRQSIGSNQRGSARCLRPSESENHVLGPKLSRLAVLRFPGSGAAPSISGAEWRSR